MTDGEFSSELKESRPDGSLTHRIELARTVEIVPSDWCRSRSKRAADVLLSLIALPVALPLIGVLSAMSAVRFRCQPLFQQERYGVNEAPFRVTKIRSLDPTHASNKGKHELSEDELCAWSQFLRKSHLDELPQIFNILFGTMSIVGPRPMIKEVIELIDNGDRITRASVRPGLTGPWQVSTMGSVSLHDCPYLDNDYVHNATAICDLKLIWFTVTTSIGSSLEPEDLARRLKW